MIDRSPAAAPPLFVTRFSLSSRTAIGVQTRLILEQFPEWQHLFWTQYESRSLDPRSYRAENGLIARSTRIRNIVPLARLLSRLDVTYWSGDSPTRRGRAFIEAFKGRTQMVYFAPIDSSDARRMRSIAELLGLPFALHLWDFLDDGLRSGDRSTRWLIDRADAVFCGSEPLLQEVRQVRPGAEMLSITRRPPTHRAAGRPASPPTIALIGDIVAYRSGVLKLLDAVTMLRAGGYGVTVRYIGRPGALRHIGVAADSPIESVGFLPSEAARDRALSECDIGFLPGPLGDPESDPRSRYSIPSRVLDFLAIGLPLVGTVHPRSAAFRFCADLGPSEFLACATPSEIARAIRDLGDPQAWSAASEAGREAFASVAGRHHYDGLIRAMS